MGKRLIEDGVTSNEVKKVKKREKVTKMTTREV